MEPERGVQKGFLLVLVCANDAEEKQNSGHWPAEQRCPDNTAREHKLQEALGLRCVSSLVSKVTAVTDRKNSRMRCCFKTLCCISLDLAEEKAQKLPSVNGS